MFSIGRVNALAVKGRFFRDLKRKKITQMKIDGGDRLKRPKNMCFFHFESSSKTPIFRFLARLQFQRFVLLMFRAQEGGVFTTTCHTPRTSRYSKSKMPL